jgi:CheY-like chemotaxis protein
MQGQRLFASAEGGIAMRKHINILIVDDEPVVLKSAWKVLNPEGYNVQCVISGKDAVQMLKKNSISLVFTDLKMPGIDGFTLIKWIKQYRPDTGIVVISAYLLPDTIKEARELGILNHIVKPFTPNMLRDGVAKALEIIRSRGVEIEQEEDFQPLKLTETASEIEPEEEFLPAKLAELDKVIDQYRNQSGKAVRVLTHAQEILGYLPPHIQKRIALGLNMFPAEVRSIVSFYSCFRTKPKRIQSLYHTSTIERAWNSVAWMTENSALHEVNEFIKRRQVTC